MAVVRGKRIMDKWITIMAVALKKPTSHRQLRGNHTMINHEMAGWWFGTLNFLIFHILGMSSSPLTKSYFSEG
jgi:hypothetical protein